MESTTRAPLVAAILPAYRVADRILDLIARIGPQVGVVIVVDDACPEKSGDRVRKGCSDPRVQVLYHSRNQGVGGAVLTGYRAALRMGADVLVKLDGDGQMDPALIPEFIGPILSGESDYTKGNRFHSPDRLVGMPMLRLVGNSVLSLMSKLSSGYYPIFDPTNGYTALHGNVARALPFERLSRRYFFESDLLFRLYTLGAVVTDIPMDAVYGDEKSSMRIGPIIPEFLWRHTVNFTKRIFYNYFLRDFNPASVQLLLGSTLMIWGTVFGLIKWHEGTMAGVTASSGTVMLAALPVFLGMQLILSFLNYDFQNVPRRSIQAKIRGIRPAAFTTEEALEGLPDPA